MTEVCDKPDEKRRILVAEDDLATLALLKRQLQRAGYTVTGCTNGREALDSLDSSGADIIIADWMMPEMTGVELCRAVSQLRTTETARSLYIILLTAHADKSKVVEGLEAGADDYLKKPYNLQELLARIRAGERIQRLQGEVIARQRELSESNAELGVLNEKLTKLANYDSLTDLPNRRYVLERFGDAWSQAQRHGRPLSCIMVDIDHFKKVNDTYGHKAGDIVLQAVAKTLQSLVRRYDVCGRIGGEEFLFVCPEEAAEGAAVLAERARATVAGQRIVADGTEIRVALSLGVAAMRSEHRSLDMLIAEADAMLYAAKEHGRNQVWCTDSDGQGHKLDQAVAVDLAASPFGS